MVPFASYVSRGQSKPRLIFSRINGPNETFNFQLISSGNTLAVSCLLYHFKLYIYFLEKVKLTCYLHM